MNFQEKLAEFNKKKLDLISELKRDFVPMFSEDFEKSKRIDSFGWRQYTPYFNDGDECIFRVNTDYIYINEEDAEEIEWLGSDFDYKTKKYTPTSETDVTEFEVYRSIKEKLSAIPEDFFKDIFGDHVEITIHRDGRVETEEYDHD